MYKCRSVTRRAALALLGCGVAAPALMSAAWAGGIDGLEFFGPPAGPSVTVAHAVARGLFDPVADNASMRAWRTPDELRAGLTSRTIRLSVVPVQAAANLYNRGFPIRLANVMTDGLLYVAASGGGIAAIPDLAGRRVAVPFKGDTPELLFKRLLAHHGLDPSADLRISLAASPIEAMQLLLAGRVDAALTAEPATTAAILRGRTGGRDIRRAIDLQAAWGAMTGAAPVVPQAGLAVTGDFLQSHGEAMPAILEALATATAGVLADPAAAGSDGAAMLGLPAPLLAASVPHCNLVARPAARARADVERMLSAMTGDEMAAIGGRLPDAGFYL